MGANEKNWFDGLYGDLFEGGSGSSDKSQETPSVTSEKEALDHAEDALKEARELLGNMDSIIDVEKVRKKRLQVDTNLRKQDGADSDKTGKEYPDKTGIEHSDKTGKEHPDKTGKEHSDEPGKGYPGQPGNAEGQNASAPQEPEEDPMEKLDQLIGLTTIKHDVKELTDFVRIQKLRKEEGLKSVPVSLHLVFTGNPGTGKTTVARILASLYKQIGVLSQGQLVEVDRSGLVAGYVGQTAIKTQEKIQEAMGGVLFIDEAYALSQKDDAFGQEAIDTILKAMEDHRDDFVVIVAGYTEPMEKFINSNPGLKSRFNKYIEFPDYTVDELEGIFDMNCKKYDYVVEEDAKQQIREQIKLRKLTRQENFANAREVRNLFEEMITNQARRVAEMENPTHEDMMTLKLEDLRDEAEISCQSNRTEEAGNKNESVGAAEPGNKNESAGATEPGNESGSGISSKFSEIVESATSEKIFAAKENLEMQEGSEVKEKSAAEENPEEEKNSAAQRKSSAQENSSTGENPEEQKKSAEQGKSSAQENFSAGENPEEQKNTAAQGKSAAQEESSTGGNPEERNDSSAAGEAPEERNDSDSAAKENSGEKNDPGAKETSITEDYNSRIWL